MHCNNMSATMATNLERERKPVIASIITSRRVYEEGTTLDIDYIFTADMLHKELQDNISA